MIQVEIQKLSDDLLDFLRKNQVDFKPHFHEAVFTVEQSKEIDRRLPGLQTKNLFLKEKGDKRFFLVCMNAHKRLEIKKIQNNLGTRKLSFGSSEELWQKLKLTPGSVSFFGVFNDTKREVELILDKEVWEAEITGFHPNINVCTLEITNANLKKFLKLKSVEPVVLDL